MEGMHCFTMGCLSIGQTFSYLHYLPLAVASLLLLAGSLSVIYLALTRGTKGRKTSSLSRIKDLGTTKSESRVWKLFGRGMGKISPVLWAAMFMAGMVVGINIPRKESQTMYNWRVQRVMPPDSWDVISRATGPFRADWCPESKIAKYEARAGYVLCRVEFIDAGCLIPIKLTWVKNNDANDSTATLTDNDTFKQWPDCHKEEEEADAR